MELCWQERFKEKFFKDQGVVRGRFSGGERERDFKKVEREENGICILGEIKRDIDLV